MTKQRRTFTLEFKREAASLVLDQGYSHIEAAQSLGSVESALRRWVNHLQQERGGVTPTSKALTPEQQKVFDERGLRHPGEGKGKGDQRNPRGHGHHGGPGPR